MLIRERVRAEGAQVVRRRCHCAVVCNCCMDCRRTSLEGAGARGCHALGTKGAAFNKGTAFRAGKPAFPCGAAVFVALAEGALEALEGGANPSIGH